MPRSVAALVVALAFLTAAEAASADPAAPCPESRDVPILASPAEPVRGQPLRIVVAAADGVPGEVRIDDPVGEPAGADVVTHPGPPWSAVATVAAPVAGRYRATFRRGDAVIACREVAVVAAPGLARQERRDWNRATEALYAAWVEHLFDAPADEDLSFPSLAPVLRDPARNFLYDHLGRDEDGDGPRAIPAAPDCADLPYLLRAYFAWKLGLPAGFRRCSRGTPASPPFCTATVVHDALGDGPDPIGTFTTFARALVDGVQSGNARTGLEDDATDFYPVALDRESLRPGTVYADPYGHTLVVAGWRPQTAEHAGMLLAVDAQPDKTVARKRFWEGTFLFTDDVAGAGPGFKAFRPLVRGASGAPHPLANRELAGGDFTPYSDEQATLDTDAFYARMQALANPQGLDPTRAYDATLDALVEQLETRVKSVDNGERFAATHPSVVVPMPSGATIFETIGPWEDFSTPSRDMRLLIAMRVLLDLPAHVVRHAQLYVLNGRSLADARAAVEARHAEQIGARTVTYTRSDGSPWTLTVADLLGRQAAFEMSYNPNDCVETRWGAPPGSPEASTCRRQAPPEQRARMQEYRPWFRDGRRPPR